MITVSSTPSLGNLYTEWKTRNMLKSPTSRVWSWGPRNIDEPKKHWSSNFVYKEPTTFYKETVIGIAPQSNSPSLNTPPRVEISSILILNCAKSEISGPLFQLFNCTINYVYIFKSNIYIYILLLKYFFYLP